MTKDEVRYRFDAGEFVYVYLRTEDTALNQANIQLVGLAQTGLEYVPFSG